MDCLVSKSFTVIICFIYFIAVEFHLFVGFSEWVVEPHPYYFRI